MSSACPVDSVCANRFMISPRVTITGYSGLLSRVSKGRVAMGLSPFYKLALREKIEGWQNFEECSPYFQGKHSVGLNG